jgi:hypothetical protein
LFLQENDIVHQIFMSEDPRQNGVVERRNRILMNMVHSMICNTTLSEYLWSEDLKISIYVLNRVPSKFVPTIPYELWTGKKPQLEYLRVWGCPAEAKMYNPHIKKLDSKTISCYFIGYPERSKCFKFYYLSHTTRIVETRHAVFFENSNISGSNVNNIFNIDEVPMLPQELLRKSQREMKSLISDDYIVYLT